MKKQYPQKATWLGSIQSIDAWQIEGKIIRDGKETIREGVCSQGAMK